MWCCLMWKVRWSISPLKAEVWAVEGGWGEDIYQPALAAAAAAAALSHIP